MTEDCKEKVQNQKKEETFQPFYFWGVQHRTQDHVYLFELPEQQILEEQKQTCVATTKLTIYFVGLFYVPYPNQEAEWGYDIDYVTSSSSAHITNPPILRDLNKIATS